MKIVEAYEIPLYSETANSWDVRVDLSGKRYGFHVAWNGSQQMWMMTLSDADGNQLLSGIRLVPGVSFLQKYRASVPNLPPGEMCLADMEERDATAEVTQDNLHTRFFLAYVVLEDE